MVLNPTAGPSPPSTRVGNAIISGRETSAGRLLIGHAPHQGTTACPTGTCRHHEGTAVLVSGRGTVPRSVGDAHQVCSDCGRPVPEIIGKAHLGNDALLEFNKNRRAVLTRARRQHHGTTGGAKMSGGQGFLDIVYPAARLGARGPTPYASGMGRNLEEVFVARAGGSNTVVMKVGPRIETSSTTACCIQAHWRRPCRGPRSQNSRRAQGTTRIQLRFSVTS